MEVIAEEDEEEESFVELVVEQKDISDGVEVVMNAAGSQTNNKTLVPNEKPKSSSEHSIKNRSIPTRIVSSTRSKRRPAPIEKLTY